MDNLFKVKENVYNKILIYEFNNINELDSVVYGMMCNNNIAGLLKVSFSGVDSYYSFSFDFDGYVKLQDIIFKLNINNLLKILKSLKKILDEIEEFLISPENIIFLTEYAFIDVSNYQLYLPCIPAKVENTTNYMQFIWEVISENEEIRMNGYLNVIEDVLKKDINCSSIIDFIEKTIINNEVEDANIESKDQIEIEKNITKINREKLVAKADKKPVKNMFLDSIFNAFKNKKKSFVVESKDEEYISFFDDEELMDDSFDCEDYDENTCESSEYSPEFEETIVVSKLINNNLTRPYLIRILTNEKIYINKDFFNLGKDSNAVDYVITDNKSISRIHAEIIKVEELYYIKDRNSKNGVFVDGIMINKNEAVEISQNTHIALSNEEFIFKVI